MHRVVDGIDTAILFVGAQLVKKLVLNPIRSLLTVLQVVMAIKNGRKKQDPEGSVLPSAPLSIRTTFTFYLDKKVTKGLFHENIGFSKEEKAKHSMEIIKVFSWCGQGVKYHLININFQRVSNLFDWEGWYRHGKIINTY